MKLIWWILRNFGFPGKKNSQSEEVVLKPQRELMVERKQPLGMGEYEELCSFCNMIRHDEGFSLQAVHRVMFVDGVQVRHFVDCPLATTGEF